MPTFPSRPPPPHALRSRSLSGIATEKQPRTHLSFQIFSPLFCVTPSIIIARTIPLIFSELSLDDDSSEIHPWVWKKEKKSRIAAWLSRVAWPSGAGRDDGIDFEEEEEEDAAYTVAGSSDILPSFSASRFRGFFVSTTDDSSWKRLFWFFYALVFAIIIIEPLCKLQFLESQDYRLCWTNSVSTTLTLQNY